MPHREVVCQADFSGLKVSDQSLGSSIGERARTNMTERFKVQEPAPDLIRGSKFTLRDAAHDAAPQGERPKENPELGTRNPEQRLVQRSVSGRPLRGLPGQEFLGALAASPEVRCRQGGRSGSRILRWAVELGRRRGG